LEQIQLAQEKKESQEEEKIKNLRSKTLKPLTALPIFSTAIEEVASPYV